MDCCGAKGKGVTVGCGGVGMWACDGARLISEVVSVCVCVCGKWSGRGMVGVGRWSVVVNVRGCEIVGTWLSCVCM